MPTPQWQQWCLVTIGLIVATFWITYAGHQLFASRRAALMANITLPFPINGLRPSIAGTQLQRGTDAWIDQNALPNTVVFIVADSCPACLRVVPGFIDWVRQSDATKYGAIVATFNGANYLNELSDALETRGVAYAAYLVTQQQEFSLAMGFSTTPQVAVLDQSGRIRLIHNALTPKFRTLLAALLEPPTFDTQLKGELR